MLKVVNAQSDSRPSSSSYTLCVTRYDSNSLGTVMQEVERERVTGQVILHLSQGTIGAVEVIKKSLTSRNA